MPFYEARGQSERKARELHYDDRTPPARPAMPLSPQCGCWFGKITGPLSATGTATFKIYTWSGTAWEDTGKTLSVRSVGLNTGQTYPAGTKGAAFRYINTWVFAPLNCIADNGVMP